MNGPSSSIAPAAAALPRTEPAPASFETLLEPVLTVAYRVALHLSRNTHDAEDLVQEAALMALRGFRTFQPGTNFKAWFLRILTNAFYARYRRAGHSVRTVSLDDTPEEGLQLMVLAPGFNDAGPDPVRDTVSRIETERIVEAIQSLPEEFRTVATLYFVEDLSYQEMAGILDCPVGTVRSRLHRGRRLLRQRLWQLAEEDRRG